jgi:hypothetical protein
MIWWGFLFLKMERLRDHHEDIWWHKFCRKISINYSFRICCFGSQICHTKKSYKITEHLNKKEAKKSNKMSSSKLKLSRDKNLIWFFWMILKDILDVSINKKETIFLISLDSWNRQNRYFIESIFKCALDWC